MLTRLLLLAAFLWTANAYAAPVTFDALLDEMTDLARLTRLPSPAYTCKQFSSYDRRSTDPGVPTDDNWFANDDAGKFLRPEKRNGADEYVMADVAGPGAVVRIWSANPDAGGTIRIYLDGAATPEIEMPLTDFLGGRDAIAPAPIAGERSKGWNSYLPIPYARHLKITASKLKFYYHIDYRTYAPGTPVETYSKKVAANSQGKIEAVAKALAEPESGGAAKVVRGEEKKTMTLAPEKSDTLKVAAPGAIVALTASVKAKDVEAALRGIALEIAFDSLAPAVVAPLGDFFATAPGVYRFAALPCGVTEEGVLYAHWVMPFKFGAVLTLTNHTAETASVEFGVAHTDYAWSDTSMYFHAKWRAERDIPTRPRKDWNFIEAAGPGRFCGVMLNISNPVRDWWGEGDEKIYVDGEAFPSFIGTGTEDYFGYAWGSPQPFTHAYHAQPRCDGPDTYGQTCVNRFHIIDDVPFTKSFKFDLEVWHWAEVKIHQAIMAYWYAPDAATDNFRPLEKGLMNVPSLPPPPAKK